MKKYKDGGEIPQEAQNTLMDRKEEKERQASKDMEREENEAPKKFVKEKFKALKDMLGIESKSTVKKAKGGTVGSASKRADGCAVKGKTKGRFR